MLATVDARIGLRKDEYTYNYLYTSIRILFTGEAPQHGVRSVGMRETKK